MSKSDSEIFMRTFNTPPTSDSSDYTSDTNCGCKDCYDSDSYEDNAQCESSTISQEKTVLKNLDESLCMLKYDMDITFLKNNVVVLAAHDVYLEDGDLEEFWDTCKHCLKLQYHFVRKDEKINNQIGEFKLQEKRFKTDNCFGNPCSNTVNLGSCGNKHHNLPECGPLSWKIKNNIRGAVLNTESLKPTKIVRCCKESCWTSAEKILKEFNRKKIKDCFADIHYIWQNCDLDRQITGAYVYIIGSIYNENSKLKYARITAQINAKLANLHYNTRYGFDVCDVVMRSPLTWQKVEYIDII